MSVLSLGASGSGHCREAGADPGFQERGGRIREKGYTLKPCNTCSFTHLNAGWKYKYPGLQDRGNLSVPEASTG